VVEKVDEPGDDNVEELSKMSTVNLRNKLEKHIT